MKYLINKWILILFFMSDIEKSWENKLIRTRVNLSTCVCCPISLNPKLMRCFI